MSRFRDPHVVVLRRPVPVIAGSGALVPVLAFGLLFAGFGARVGLPVLVTAVVGALGGTASLVIHELGHVRAAQKLSGLRPVSISVIWLGAATRLEGAYGSGRDQARVAIAGPLTSFALAATICPLLFTPIPQSARELLLTLALLNIAIGALNLVPASPLDGYKLIVGLLWSLIGTESSARRLVRRCVSVLVGLEVVGACILLATKPALGVLVLLMGASFYGQKFFARRMSA